MALSDYLSLEDKYQQYSSFLTGSDRNIATLAMSKTGGDKFAGRYLYRRAKGGDALNMRRFVQVFLVKKLIEEERYNEALTEVAIARKEASLVARDVRIDEGDQHTYLQTQTSDNALLLWELIARLRLTSQRHPDALSVVLDYLQVRNALWSTMELFHQTGIEDEMIGWAGGVLATTNPALSTTWPRAVIAAWQDGASRIVTVSPDPKFRGAGRATFRISGSGESIKTTLLSGDDAYRKYQSHIASLVTVRDTENSVVRISILCDSGECEVAHQSGSITLRNTEVQKLLGGQALPRTHALSLWLDALEGKAVLVVGNPFQERGTQQRQLTDAVLYSMQENYPDRLIVRDKPTEDAAPKTARLLALKRPSPSDIVALIPDESFRVNDRAIIDNVEDGLQKAGVRIERAEGVEWRWEHGSGKTVIIITGHSDAALTTYVRYLGDRNTFRGNVVVLNSCGTTATRELADSINRDYGAEGTLVFEKRIQAYAVEEFLKNVAAANEVVSDETLSIWLLRSARDAKLKGIWTVAHFLRRTSEYPNELEGQLRHG